MLKHVPVEGSERVPLAGARVIGRTAANSTVDVSLKLRRKRKLPELESRPAVTMTRKAFAANYGASAGDIYKVVKCFKKYGLKYVSASAATRTIRLRGTVVQLEEAFQTKLFDYAHEGGSYRGRASLDWVLYIRRASFKGIVEAGLGLDSRRVARRRRQPVNNRGRLVSTSMLIPTAWYTPGRLAAHYNFPSGDGGGQTIGLLEFEAAAMAFRRI